VTSSGSFISNACNLCFTRFLSQTTCTSIARFLRRTIGHACATTTMQPAKRQRVETSFDLYAYLFLNLNCSKSLIDTLMRMAPPKLLTTATLCRIASDVMDTFEKHKDNFEEGVYDCTRLYRLGKNYIGVEPYFCANYGNPLFICIYILRNTSTPYLHRGTVHGVNVMQLCSVLPDILGKDVNWFFNIKNT